MTTSFMTLIKLWYEFMKAGLFAVGGGLATLPFLYEIGEKTGWYTAHDVSNMIAISQSTPGPMGINMATYIGFTVAELTGALVATTGLVFPSIVIIVAISKALDKFKESKLVQKIFYGLRPASTGLIVAAGWEVARVAWLNIDKFKDSKKIVDLINYKSVILSVFLFYILKKFKIHPILIIVISVVLGILLKFE